MISSIIFTGKPTSLIIRLPQNRAPYSHRFEAFAVRSAAAKIEKQFGLVHEFGVHPQLIILLKRVQQVEQDHGGYFRHNGELVQNRKVVAQIFVDAPLAGLLRERFLPQNSFNQICSWCSRGQLYFQAHLNEAGHLLGGKHIFRVLQQLRSVVNYYCVEIKMRLIKLGFFYRETKLLPFCS